jgi:uncharacterized membrane protein YGL010W
MKVILKMAGEEWIYKGKAHRNPFTVKKLKRLIEPYFKVVEISYKAGLYPSLKYMLLPTLRISPSFTFVLKKKMILNRYP